MIINAYKWVSKQIGWTTPQKEQGIAKTDVFAPVVSVHQLNVVVSNILNTKKGREKLTPKSHQPNVWAVGSRSHAEFCALAFFHVTHGETNRLRVECVCFTLREGVFYSQHWVFHCRNTNSEQQPPQHTPFVWAKNKRDIWFTYFGWTFRKLPSCVVMPDTWWHG